MENIRFKVNVIKRLDSEKAACGSIVLFYIWQAGNLLVQKCFGGNQFLVLAMYLILAASVGISVLNAIRGQFCYFLLAMTAVMTAYMLSYIYGYAQFSTLAYYLFWSVMICVSVAANVLSIGTADRLNELLYRLAKPMILTLCGTIFLEFIVLKTNTGEYDMPVSYALIFYCIVLCNAVLEQGKFKDIAVLALGLGFVLLWGSRGTYICFAFFVLLKILFDIDSGKKKRFLLLGGMGIVFLGIILVVFIQMYGADGMEIIRFRSLGKILSGELFRSDSRVKLYGYYTGLMAERPVLGWGVTGNWIDAQNYPHNFFLEAMMAFGMIPGVLMFLLIFFVLFYMLKRRKEPERTLFLIYFSNAFSLMVSGTFLQSMHFYFCIFLGMRYMRRRLPQVSGKTNRERGN